MTNTYYTENKASILAQQKQYREVNKEYRNAQKLEHYEINKEAILQRKGTVIQCECGRTYTLQHKQRHFNTNVHNGGLTI
jgi:hypothetical protein